jgi:hypothetical protein
MTDDVFYKTDASLEEARQWTRAGSEKGVKCPCCDRRVKLEKRPFNEPMATVLILIYRHFESNPTEEWLHVESFIPQKLRGDWTRMKEWGFIEKMPKTAPIKVGVKRAGHYRITDLGRQFVRREMSAAAHYYSYNGKRQPRRVDEKIFIEEVIENKREGYDALMAGT